MELSPTMKLSLGGLSFNIVPKEGDIGSVKLHQQGAELFLDLESFTGSLKVEMTKLSETAMPDYPKFAQISPRPENVSPDKPKRDLAEEQVTPPSSKRQKQQVDPNASLPPVQTPEEPIVEEERESPEDEMSQDLLAQPDMSQTQPSSCLHSDEYAAELNEASNDSAAMTEQQSKIQQLIEKPSQACSPQSLSQQSHQSSVKSVATFIIADNDNVAAASPAKVVPARVSIGSSPAMKRHNSHPCPRWGHSMTHIGADRILVYGGQAFDDKTGLPKTMKDLQIFDMKKQHWFKPFKCEGMPRQWHSATYLPERQLMISFGGESANPKTGKIKTTDEVMVLDTEIMLWYPPTVSGEVPSGRSGHTATILPDTNELVVFGGVKGSKWLNSISVLDTLRWVWRTPKIQGLAPPPRSYHTATSCSGGRIVVFGGNDATTSFDTLHVLETAGDKWQWMNIQASGDGPTARTGHSATVMADNKTICIYGGWDPNADDEESQQAAEDGDLVFDESFLLDTEKWVWTKGPRAVHCTDIPADVHGDCCSAKRVGHTAILSEDKSHILLFGGRIPGDKFAGDFQSITLK